MDFKRILLATDGSPLSKKAEQCALGLARATKAHVVALHVTPPFHAFTFRPQLLLTYHTALSDDTEEAYDEAVSVGAQKILREVARAAAKTRVSCSVLRVSSDQPHREILTAARKESCDLIVMASHGRTGIGSILLGSETQKVLTLAKLPVLVCR